MSLLENTFFPNLWSCVGRQGSKNRTLIIIFLVYSIKNAI